MTPWILALATAAWADPLLLSYDDALKRAQEGNADLRSADADVQAAEGALLAERGAFDPTLAATLGYASSANQSTYQGGDYASQQRDLSSKTALTWFAPTGTSASLALKTDSSRVHYDLTAAGTTTDPGAQVGSLVQASVSQALLRGYRMSYNLSGVHRATAARDEAEATANATREQALSDTASAYWGLYSARREVEIAKQTVGIAVEEQRIVAAQIAEGKLANMEQSRVDALSVQAQSALIDAQNAEAVASDTLLLLLGETPGQAIVLTTAPSDPTPVTLDEDGVVKGALANNPTLQALRMAEAYAAQSYADARHGRLPELDASASYGLNGYEPTLPGSLAEAASFALPEWSVGATLSAPLGNRALRGAASTAEASASKARTAREAEERSIAQQVRAQVRTLSASASQVQLALANQTYANQTLAAERALQEVGRAIQRDVLDAIGNADSAAVAVEQARATWLSAIVELERLKGTL